MYTLALSVLPTVPAYPVRAVVPHRADGGDWTIFAGEEPIPTFRAPCIKRGRNRSTEVRAIVRPDQHARGLTIRPHDSPHNKAIATWSIASHDAYIDLKAKFAQHLTGLTYKLFADPYGDFQVFELTLQLYNGDVRKPRGHVRVNLGGLTPPPGWAFVPLDARRVEDEFTLHQGAKWDWRFLVCPVEWIDVAKAWANEAGRGLALDADGRSVAPLPLGFEAPIPSQALTTYLQNQVVPWMAQFATGTVQTGWAPYGTDVQGGDGEQDPGGQGYGGPTGGMEWEKFRVELLAAIDGTELRFSPFRFLEYLRSTCDDRNLYLVDAGEPFNVETALAGFKFALSPEVGVDLAQTNSGDVYGFNAQPNAPGTTNRKHGPHDRQHGVYRTAAAMLLAAMFNDQPSIHTLALDAGTARAEFPPAKIRSRGDAMNRADGFAGWINVATALFTGDTNVLQRCQSYADDYTFGLRAAMAANGRVGAWDGKESIWYAMDFKLAALGLTAAAAAWKVEEKQRTGKDPTEPAWIAWCATQGVTYERTVRPEQNLIKLWPVWMKGELRDSLVDFDLLARGLTWVGETCRETEADGSRHAGPCVRVGLDGQRLDAADENHYFRTAIAMVVGMSRRLHLTYDTAWRWLREHTSETTVQGMHDYFNNPSRYKNAAGLIAALQRAGAKP